MRIHQRRAARASECCSERLEAQISGLGRDADLPRVAAHHDSKREAVGHVRLQFLDAARGDVRRVRETRHTMLGGGAIDFEFRQVAFARQHCTRLADEVFQLQCRAHRSFYPPPSRARERMVGPPLDMRLTCIGCPFPQLGIAISRRSLPTASTCMKKSLESAMTL